jgi:sporulation protein YlmC with PRC-barrel domain
MERQIQLGMGVQALDGPVGTVASVVVDPEHREPAYLVLRRRKLRASEVVVPVSLVSEVRDEKVFLEVDRESLQGFPAYEVTLREGDYRKPVAGPLLKPAPGSSWASQGYAVLRARSVPDRTVAVERGMGVVDALGQGVGRVDGLILSQETRQASHLVLRHQEPLLNRGRLLPIDLVEDVRAGEVRLNITASQVYGLGSVKPMDDPDGAGRARGR